MFLCASMEYIFIYNNNSMNWNFRHKRLGVLKRGILGLRICVGGSGISLDRKNRFIYLFQFIHLKNFKFLSMLNFRFL